jgi:hypothetical protein
MAGRAETADLDVVDDLDSVVELAEAHEDLFLRYSRGPEADRDRVSRDYEAGIDMPGLSVTPIRPEPWWTRPAREWVARRICKYRELNEADRFPWLLTGQVVGAGPDHEPLVDHVHAVARVGDEALREAKQCYQEAFEVSRDSRAGA